MTSTPQSQPPRLMLIELNEVNGRLLKKAVAELDLPNLKRVVGFSESATTTKDEYDSGYLEPWVQWVSIHTGQPSAVHHIMHLGDVPNLSQPQIWETLSINGISSGVFGIMNGSRRTASACAFFVADPWTFSEPPYPASLSGLTDFAQYIARNYLNLSPLHFVRLAWTYLIALVSTIGVRDLALASGIFLEGLMRFGPSNAVLGAFYEYTAALSFLALKRKHDVRFSIVFFNLLAHIQHHYWQAKTISAQLAYGFKVMDRAIGRLLGDLDQGETVLVANGLSQTNTNEDRPWVLYRPHDPATFLHRLGIAFERVEALMTHDCHVFFGSAEDREAAFALLSEARVGDQQLFYVERDSDSPLKLFYRLEFTDEVPADTTFTLGGKTFPFFDLFKRVVVRTGKHCQEGFVFQSSSVVPEHLENHLIYDGICRYFGAAVAKPDAPRDAGRVPTVTAEK